MNSYDLQYMALKVKKLNSIVKKETTVVSVAKDLAVSRQTIHKWLSRYKRFGLDGLVTLRKKSGNGVHNRTSPEVEQLVINMAKKYFEDGVETIHDRLEAECNTSLHPATIYRILKRNNVRYTSMYAHTKMRWKKQLYAHKIAGLELQMDTKYPYGYKQGKVIYTIIDDASRWVFAWSYDTANAINTVDFLEKVIQRARLLSRRLEQTKVVSLFPR
jgi:transposase